MLSKHKNGESAWLENPTDVKRCCCSFLERSKFAQTYNWAGVPAAHSGNLAIWSS